MTRAGAVVAAADGGQRLDAWLASPAVGLAPTRGEATRLIAAGRVHVDGVAATQGKRRLDAGARVEVDPPPPPADPADDDRDPVASTVVVDDPDFLIVDKPAGVVVHPSPGHAVERTLVPGLVALGAAGGDVDRPGLVHRLDRDTSGLLLVARSDEALALLQAALREREIHRDYVALVAGAPSGEAGRIDGPLGRHPTKRTEQAVVAGGRPAVTRFTVRERLAAHTLLDVSLDTGRTHQIRVHLRAIGLPVVGDPTYGRPGLGLDRQFLHAGRLRLTHPRTGAPIDARSPLPPDLAVALERARELRS